MTRIQAAQGGTALALDADTEALPPIRAVIFDCDGTLVDSETPGLEVLLRMARALGVELDRDEAHRRFRGVRMAEVVAWIAARVDGKGPNFEAEFIREARAAMAKRFHEALEPLPGAYELLRRLRIPFCVATNGPREKVEMTLKLTGLRELVGERIYCAYDVGSFKPDPGLFLHAAAALGEAPEGCAVVEDSLPGILAGINAGMQVYSLHERAGIPDESAAKIVFIDSLFALQRRWEAHLAP
jgi:HAD superfamily hydrolase (TIGR01509 family)